MTRPSFETTPVTGDLPASRITLRFLSPTAFPTPGTVMRIIDEQGVQYGTATVLPDGGLHLHADPR